MLRVIKVAGSSLSPFFLTGDYVITSKPNLFFKDYKRDDFIVFVHPVLGILIKEILDFDPIRNVYQVQGTNSSSINSRALGEIPRDAILGKVIWHIKKPR